MNKREELKALAEKWRDRWDYYNPEETDADTVYRLAGLQCARELEAALAELPESLTPEECRWLACHVDYAPMVAKLMRMAEAGGRDAD